MALNEEKILSDKFIFISYSHKDSDAVKEDMTALLARGVRVWYDENMRLGDDWTEIAKRAINHENCIGVLFYNSPSAFISKAVQAEQQLTREKAEKSDFKVWSVHLDGKQTPQICIEACSLLGNYMEYFSTAMPLQQLMFSDKVLCILRSESESAVERIYNEIAVPYHLVDNEDNFLDDARKSNSTSKGTDEIVFGKYIASEYYGPEQPIGTDNQRFGSQKNLIQLDGKRYTSKDLRWKLMYVADGKAVLLCTQILSQMPFNVGKSFLESEFSQVAFLGDDLERIGGVAPRYMTAQDAAKCAEAHKDDALKLANPGELTHWWIDADGLTPYWKQTYKDDYNYKKGFSIFIKKGIRPVLEVPTKNFNK